MQHEMNDDPPYEIKGKVIPFVGISPSVVNKFIITCINKNPVSPAIDNIINSFVFFFILEKMIENIRA